MKIQSTDTPLQEWSGDCLGVGFFEDQVEQSETFSTLNTALEGLLQEVVAESEFKGKSGETTWLRSPSNTTIARKVVLVGLGKPESWTLDRASSLQSRRSPNSRGDRRRRGAIAAPRQSV
jgi:leucyl aminopeptidase